MFKDITNTDPSVVPTHKDGEENASEREGDHLSVFPSQHSILFE